MMKVLDRYLLTRFLQALLVVVVAVGLTITVINMVEGLRDFVDHDVPMIIIAEYYLYFAGWIIKTFMPMFVLLAVLFSVSILARKNEILAMKACGLSLSRITAPFLVMTLLIAAGHFYYNEYIFPPANQKRIEIKEYTFKARSRKVRRTARDVYRQIQPGYFYTIGLFNVDRKSGSNFKLYRTDGNQLREMITAEEIVYEDFIWKIRRGVARKFNGPLQESFEEFEEREIKDIKDKPEDFAKRIGRPEDMSFDEIRDYISIMKRTGGPYLRELVQMRVKISYPLASVIVVLICVPFAASPRRGAVAVAFATGTGLSLLYFVLFRVMQSAAYNEKLPVDVGVWGANVLFFITGLILMARARK